MSCFVQEILDLLCSSGVMAPYGVCWSVWSVWKPKAVIVDAFERRIWSFAYAISFFVGPFFEVELFDSKLLVFVGVAWFDAWSCPRFSVILRSS